VAGRVNGAVDVNVTLRGYANGVTPESIDASGRVDMSRSTIGGVDIDNMDYAFAKSIYPKNVH